MTKGELVRQSRGLLANAEREALDGNLQRKSERERLSDSLGELRDGLTKRRLLKLG